PPLVLASPRIRASELIGRDQVEERGGHRTSSLPPFYQDDVPYRRDAGGVAAGHHTRGRHVQRGLFLQQLDEEPPELTSRLVGAGVEELWMKAFECRIRIAHFDRFILRQGRGGE